MLRIPPAPESRLIDNLLRSPLSTNPFDSPDPAIYEVATRAPGPAGSLPLTEEMLRERPSGDLFGWTQNAGMGWEPSRARRA
jgi:xylonate dehydratase